MRTLKDYLLISLKGIGMGAADVVPGISGGTIAFITGIYEELINSIKSINKDAIVKLAKEGVLSFWKHINGSFLIALFLGIGISIVSLAKGITYLLNHHPILVWAFFFGLIVASAIVVGRNIKKWRIAEILFLLIGGGIAFYITIATPAETPEAAWFIFISGMIAICAMILPGISGSFILLLLGKYSFILAAVSSFNFKTIAVFATGCIVGLLSFSHVLSWMFKKHYSITIAVLTGFMVGSLNKVWPWKKVLEYRANSHGESVPFIEQSISPLNYDGEPQLILAIVLAIVGFGIVFLIEKMGAKK